MSTIYLYLKQHKVSGLKYFGKTTKHDFEKYLGSGLHWKRHLRKHGKNIDTLCVWEFDNEEECNQFAIQFSIENDIVASDQWANLIEESGLTGGFTGYHKPETIEKMRISKIGKKQIPKQIQQKSGLNSHWFGKTGVNKGRKNSLETLIRKRKAQSKENNPMFGRKHSEETRRKMREAKLRAILKKSHTAIVIS